jgi:sugar phosphate isomerase/epimerase
MEIENHLSFHAVYERSVFEALEYAKNHGFKGIQLAIETPHFDIDQYNDDECSRIRKYCNQNSIYITLHGPDEITSLFISNSNLRKGIMTYYEQLFKIAEKIGSQLITIHLGSIPQFPTDTLQKQRFPLFDQTAYQKVLEQNLKTIVKIAENRFLICIENYMLEPFMLQVLESFLKNHQLWLCWDIAKTFSKTGVKNIDLENFFINHLECVKQVHLHDINIQGESHRIIGSGRLDFLTFLHLFEKVDVYDFCVEVRPKEKANESKNNLLKLFN